MKRISYWVLSTVSVVVLLFGYHTSTAGVLSAGSSTSVHSGTFSASSSSTSSASSGSASSGSESGDTTGGTTSDSGSAASGSSGSSAAKTVTGDVAQTRWGPVQVQLEVTGSKISNVTVLQYPNGNGRDQEINASALPVLTQETIDAQSAEIDMVSGATVTSDGYLQSLQSALDQAGL